MSYTFPRLLIATEFPPNAPGGGPAVVRQMLREWPAEKLLWWSCFADHDQRFGRTVNVHRVATVPPHLYPQRRWRRLKSWMMENIWTSWAERHFQKTLELFQPDAVWVIPHVWAIPPLTQVLLKSKTGFHTTIQDYVDAHNNISRFGIDRARRLAISADELYSRATTRDATSHPMIEDLRSRTGSEAAQILHAGFEKDDFAYLSTKRESQLNEIRIAYPGTIIVEKDFELFVKALSRVRQRLPAPVTLEFFGAISSRLRDWFDPSWMREHGNLPAETLSQRLRDCTWGLALMGLSDDDPRYNRFSFPTKFIACLAAGLPVIVFGHAESSIVKMAKTYRVGPCLTSRESAKIEQELLLALAIQDPWSQFGQEIQRCGRVEFDADRMRKVLYECFLVCSQRLCNR
jgi:glycosyltransferase involved in cell wall biosynthesis